MNDASVLGVHVSCQTDLVAVSGSSSETEDIILIQKATCHTVPETHRPSQRETNRCDTDVAVDLDQDHARSSSMPFTQQSLSSEQQGNAYRSVTGDDCTMSTSQNSMISSILDEGAVFSPTHLEELQSAMTEIQDSMND